MTTLCIFTAAHIAKSKAASALELVAARTFHDPVPTSLADTNVRSLYECRCRSFFSFALGRRLSRVGHPVLFTIQPSVVRRHAADKATCFSAIITTKLDEFTNKFIFLQSMFQMIQLLVC